MRSPPKVQAVDGIKHALAVDLNLGQVEHRARCLDILQRLSDKVRLELLFDVVFSHA
jgi:hypothetical protein